MAATPVFLLENPMDEEPGGLQPTGSQTLGHNWMANTFTFSLSMHLIGLPWWLSW